MPYSTYIFDLDGTLLDTLGDLTNSVNYAMQTHHLPEHTIDEVRMMVGNGVRRLMERAIPEGNANPCFDDAFTTFRQYYLEHQFDTTRPYDGIEDMLRQLKQRGCLTAVVSNKFDKATKRLCHHFFNSLIDVAIGENEAAGIRKKPAPDTVFEAIRRLGAKREDAVYVGDSDVDIATAQASGIPCISVLWGFRNREFLIEKGATVLIGSPQKLLNIEKK